MTCKKCGTCCRAICISADCKSVINETIQAGKPLQSDARFIHDNFIELTPEEALTINPHLQEWDVPPEATFWKCKAFDEKNNLCTIHDKRTRLCIGFPFYDRDDWTYLYTPECGYAEENEKRRKYAEENRSRIKALSESGGNPERPGCSGQENQSSEVPGAGTTEAGTEARMVDDTVVCSDNPDRNSGSDNLDDIQNNQGAGI